MCKIPITSGDILDKIKPENYHGERADVDHTLLLLQSLETYLFQFSAAVGLLEHTEQLCRMQYAQMAGEIAKPSGDPFKLVLVAQKYTQWSMIAVRDAGMTIYHFKKTIDALNHSIRRCQILYQKLDHDALTQAGRLFSQSFPRAERLRHAIAHSAEHKDTRETFALHMENGVYWENALDGKTFTLSRQRERLSVEISENTKAILDGVIQYIRNAFAPAL